MILSAMWQETNGKEPIHGRSEVDLNRVPLLLGKDITQFEWAATQENVNHILIEQEIEEAEANTTDADDVAYMEAPSTEFKNAST